MTANIHGGDVYNNRVKYDFSVNINPLGAPNTIIDAIKASTCNVEKYPDYDSNLLRDRLADIFHASADQVIITAGASQAFMAICQCRRYKNAVVEKPSFYGYEYALAAINAKVMHLSRSAILRGEYSHDTEAIFIANPNNPNGLMYTLDQLLTIIKAASSRGIDVIVDECFLPLSDRPNDSLIPIMLKNPDQFSHLIVVRSFTKTFAMPDVRLGYAVTNCPKTAFDIKRQLPEWNISSLGQAAGLAALDCINELSIARDLIRTERLYVQASLDKMAMSYEPSSANYILFKGPEDLYESLLNEQILIRDCSNYIGCYKGDFRIAIKNHESNVALISAMEHLYE